MERLKNEYAEMSTVKKIVFGVGLLAAITFFALSASGVLVIGG